MKIQLPATRALMSCMPLMLMLAACGGGGSSGSDDSGSDGAMPAVSDVFANPEAAGADVGWTLADSSQVTGYLVTAAAAGHPTVSKTVPGSANAATLSGLVADQDYTITVNAQYSAGSTPSTTATVHVPRLINTLAETTAFQSAATYSASHTGDAVLIMRDGQIVFERYNGDFSRDDIHVLASGTKSFSCGFMLAAETGGYVTRDQKASDVITEWKSDPNKSQATVRQLLSLQSGLSTNPDYSPANVGQLDTYQLAIDDPANYAPGDAFIYDPLAFQAFALMFERKSGNTDPIEFIRSKVFTPIGLSGDVWQRDAQNHPQMAGGASLSAPMWARYGQLMLQNGTWQSARVLPAEGVKDCLTYANPAYLGYGISWWLNRNVGDTYDPSVDMIPADGVAGPSGQIAPNAPADLAMAAGTGHQRLYLLPTQRLVVVRLAPLSTETDEWSDDEFLSRLLGS
ncbi:MAG: CubicO group peptidase beta-lactamase class family [Hydrocarboniphaga sp.]|uniref:serine hydrolase n=1 Tax=Hydrocarboniphaga sp. TaxID=2033016 RepID=UPI00263A24F5|nr:serine hydrolase [Hydrocarboniphaga sp.]MDB5967777.1 CubicO group peptidase beta-lactamase class family [Hydrocarboniphaga sp.]